MKSQFCESASEVHILVWNTACSNGRRHLKTACCLRRGPQTDLAPLIDVFPSATRPELRPFAAEELQAAFALQPGAYELPEVHARPARVWIKVCMQVSLPV